VSEGHERGPVRGVGIGLRSPHHEYILEHRPPVPWLEVLTDNYLVDGGPRLRLLEAIAERYPVTLHGVGMGLGDTDPLDLDYLRRLHALAERIGPAWISDHLCWCAQGGRHSHELLPLPYTQEAVAHVADRIRQVQDFLGQRLVVENVSSYVEYQSSQMSEWAFLSAVAEAADCEILLDINNIYVSAANHGFSAQVYLEGVPHERVREMHLAGYEDHGTHLLDSHSQPVHGPVWDLYARAAAYLPHVPTLIEWDNDIPAFARLMAEADKARQVQRDACHAG